MRLILTAAAMLAAAPALADWRADSAANCRAEQQALLALDTYVGGVKAGARYAFICEQHELWARECALTSERNRLCARDPGSAPPQLARLTCEQASPGAVAGVDWRAVLACLQRAGYR